MLFLAEKPGLRKLGRLPIARPREPCRRTCSQSTACSNRWSRRTRPTSTSPWARSRRSASAASSCGSRTSRSSLRTTRSSSSTESSRPSSRSSSRSSATSTSRTRCRASRASASTSSSSARRAAPREDPDVILLGEMRDLETIGTAITAAETGHLVFATLHTQSAPSTIDRIIDAFEAAQQEQIRVQLAATLQGVVTQALLPTADGSGRIAALEILFPNDAVRNLIRQGKVEQIYSVMQTGTGKGMQTMEQALADLTIRGVITKEIALGRSSRPDQLVGLLERAGFVDGDETAAAPEAPLA